MLASDSNCGASTCRSGSMSVLCWYAICETVIGISVGDSLVGNQASMMDRMICIARAQRIRILVYHILSLGNIGALVGRGLCFADSSSEERVDDAVGSASGVRSCWPSFAA